MKQSALAKRWMLLALSAPFLSAVGLAQQTPTFSVQILANLSGGANAYVYGINNSAEAVGSAGGGTSACPNYCAVIWHDGAPTLLDMGSASGAEALAANDAGQVVGSVAGINAMGAEVQTAVVWNNGTPTLLPSPAPYTNTIASSINDVGQVAGQAYGGAPELGAIVWNGVTPTVLDAESGCTAGGYATAINSGGTVVGVNHCPSDVVIVWHGTTPTLLGDGEPYAVNNAGLIVGISSKGATTWINGVATPLQTFSGAYSRADSYAAAVNNGGLIVGRARVSNPVVLTYHALLWSSVSAAPQDLNDLISAAAAKKYVLTEATGINGSCTIVVNGFSRKDTINNIAFLLKPTNPSSCANGLLEH